MRNLIERRRASEKGFTLIELLVVIVILGILAAVVVFAVGGLTDKGEGSSCKIDTRTLKTAQEAFFAKVPSGSQYAANDAALVSAKLLGEQSSLHETVGDPGVGTDGILGTADDVVGPNTSYRVFVTDSKCGTADTNGATGGWLPGSEVTPANANNK